MDLDLQRGNAAGAHGVNGLLQMCHGEVGHTNAVGQALFLGIRQRLQGLGHGHSITW